MRVLSWFVRRCSMHRCNEYSVNRLKESSLCFLFKLNCAVHICKGQVCSGWPNEVPQVTDCFVVCVCVCVCARVCVCILLYACSFSNRSEAVGICRNPSNQSESVRLGPNVFEPIRVGLNLFKSGRIGPNLSESI